MKHTKVLRIAVACHVAGWAIIAFQFVLTALTLFPIIIAIPFLNWIPPLAVLAKGLRINSRALIVSFPVFIGIWLVPSALYRLAILPAYYSANASSETQLFDSGLPDALLVRTNKPVGEDTELLLHSGALSELVVARPWDSSDDIIYDANNQTVDLRHLLFTTYRKKQLSDCGGEYLNVKNLLQDFGPPACIHSSDINQSLPQSVIFQEVEDGSVKSTHTIFGKITQTGVPDPYNFEELGRHTQKFKVFHVPALLPIFWIPSDRRSANHPVFFMIRWQAGSKGDTSQELIQAAYKSGLKNPKYPVENEVNFRNRFEYSLQARSARSEPEEKLDGLFAGSTPKTLLARLAEIDAALPDYKRYPSISRMHALKGFRSIAEFLCVMGAANETSSFILGTRRSRSPLLDECHANLSADELQAAFALGEEAVRRDEQRAKSHTLAREAFQAKYSQMRSEPTKVAHDNMVVTYHIQEERRKYVLEARLHEKGRTLRKPATLGVAIGDQPETLFIGTYPSRDKENYVSISNPSRFGNSAKINLSEADVALMAQALDSDAPALVLNHGERSIRLNISQRNADALEDMITEYRDLLALKAAEDEHIVAGTSW